jgi:RNA polymerase sigma factor (sigma-70 family)
MENPFHINYTDEVDDNLVKLSLNGDKNALQNLVMRHQVFVYNLALKMTRSIEDAEDLTQEVFIKAITALSKFEGKSKFRTWLYRITVNHFLNAKKRKSELLVKDFQSYFDAVDNMPDIELNREEERELSESIEEIRIRCTAGMLLCLNREQRIVYVLGEMFNVDHNLGSEIMGITPANFRIRLMRARRDLYNWMNKRCGLVNKSNPCSCAKKTKSYIDAGFVDPHHLVFNNKHQKKIYQFSQDKAALISDTIDQLYQNVFLTHPLHESVTSAKIIQEILNDDLIKLILKV